PAPTRPDTASCVSATAARQASTERARIRRRQLEADHCAATENPTRIPLPGPLYRGRRLTSDRGQDTASPSAGPPSPMPSRTRTDNLHAPAHICLLLQ